jgi:hypothetical protein
MENDTKAVVKRSLIIVIVAVFLDVMFATSIPHYHEVDGGDAADDDYHRPTINDHYYQACFSDDRSLNVTFTVHLALEVPSARMDRFVLDTGDGEYLTVNDTSITYRYPRQGSYSTRLCRYVGESMELLWSLDIPVFPVEDDLPVAAVRTNRITVRYTDPLILSGEGSYDMDGGIAGYFWEYGDGTFDDRTKGINGFIPEPERVHHYEKTGQYTAKLYVMDTYNNICVEPAVVTLVIISMDGGC